MNPQQFRTRKPSQIKSYQQLLLNKVNFPSPDLILTRLSSIKKQEIHHKQLRVYPTNQKLDKLGSDSEPSCFITNLIKLCNLENTQAQTELQKRVQHRHQYGQVQSSLDQDNLIRMKTNYVRARQLSNDFLTDRTMKSSVSPNKKKVRFYEKIEYWVLCKDKNLECDYRYFEPLKFQ